MNIIWLRIDSCPPDSELLFTVARSFVSLVLLAFSSDSLLSGPALLEWSKQFSALLHLLVRDLVLVGPAHALDLARGALLVPLPFAWLLFQLSSSGAPLLLVLGAILEQETQGHQEFPAWQGLAACILRNLQN